MNRPRINVMEVKSLHLAMFIADLFDHLATLKYIAYVGLSNLMLKHTLDSMDAEEKPIKCHSKNSSTQRSLFTREVKGEGEEDPVGHAPTATPAPICSMMASAKALHFRSVAPSMRRSKSYVTVFAPMAPSMPWMMRSAASVHPM